MPCGHFMGGRVVERAGVFDVHHPSDGGLQGRLPLADAAVRESDAAHRQGD